MSDRSKTAKKLSAKKKKYQRCHFIMSEQQNSSAGTNHMATSMQKFCIDSNIMLNAARKCSITGNNTHSLHLNCIPFFASRRTPNTKDAEFSLKDIEMCVISRYWVQRNADKTCRAKSHHYLHNNQRIALSSWYRARCQRKRHRFAKTFFFVLLRQIRNTDGMAKYSHIERARAFFFFIRFTDYPIIECGGVLSMIICQFLIGPSPHSLINKCNEAIVCWIFQCGNLHACLYHNDFFSIAFRLLCFFFHLIKMKWFFSSYQDPK